MELLRSPHFLGLFVRYTGALGHVGDYVAKNLALLCALSAPMGRPIQPSTHAQSSAGKNALWDSVLSFLPPEMVVRRTGLSAKALFSTTTWSSLAKCSTSKKSTAARTPTTPSAPCRATDAWFTRPRRRCPTAPCGTSSTRSKGRPSSSKLQPRNHLHPENETRVFPIFVDESNRQTRRILDSYLREAEEGGADPQERERILEWFRDAIRLLEPGEVVIPYARRIRIPDSPVRVRRDARRLLDLIRVIAWAHQHQRDHDESGRIIATEDDFRKALGLATQSLASAWKSLAPAEEDILKAIEELPLPKKRNGFGRTDLDVEGRDGRRVQDALKSLASTGYLDCDGRRGPQGYRYTLVREPGEKRLGISLRPSGEGEDGDDDGASDDPEAEDPVQGGAAGEDEERGLRDIARNHIRAIESGDLQEEGAIARSREEDEEDYFQGDEFAEDEDDIDHLAALTELGWYRAETTFAAQDLPEDYALDSDPVARRLRHDVGIYRGRNYNWMTPLYKFETPWVVSAEELFEMGPEEGTERGQGSAEWPASPGQMSARLERVIPRLQSHPHQFWDPGLSDWYAQVTMDHPFDLEKVCKPAYLHAERWRNEHSGEELWALVALQEAWGVPDEAIEEAVHRRVTSGPRTAEEIEPVASPEVDEEFEL